MANKNYVCTVCSQTFTRKWRGRVHNDNIHLGSGEIVRLIDYIIGRINGQYLPSDPSNYRRKNRNIYGNSGDKNSFDQMGTSLRSQRYNSYSQHPYDIPNASTSSASDQPQQFQEAIIKMAKLKKILSKCFPPNEVQEDLGVIWSLCLSRGDYSPLDKALKDYGVVDEFRKATDYLGKS
jgi:hypothetical protein